MTTKLSIPLPSYEEALSDRERVYVEEVLRGATYKTASIKAGYKRIIYKPKWLVREVIRLRMAEEGAKNRITTERILGELAAAAFSHPDDFVDENGQPGNTRIFRRRPRERS